MLTPSRHHDNRDTIYTFLDEFLVVCPRCSKCARILRREPDTTDWFAPRRLVCIHCGLAKEWAGREIAIMGNNDPPIDSYFQLPLWLRTNCCNETLWAYNLRHLAILEAFVAASLRMRTRDAQFGWANTSLISRLPKWLQAAKNRQAILKAIGQLKATVE